MIEIPESKVLATQLDDVLYGRTIVEVVDATSPHKFAWYYSDPKIYGKILSENNMEPERNQGIPPIYKKILTGRQVESARGHGTYVDILLDSDTIISVGDGTNVRYYPALQPHPKKHQLLLVFDDASFLVFTVAMYGCIFASKGAIDNSYYQGSLKSIPALSDDFDENYFDKIFKSVKKDLSVKALLATEQRIPGLGNGVLQDILFCSGIHPRRKISTLSDFEKGDLFHCLKATLQSMTDKGGRDTEKDIYGNWGKYKTLLSKNTYKDPCPNCGGEITKEAYLGGSVYYCAHCQKL